MLDRDLQRRILLALREPYPSFGDDLLQPAVFECSEETMNRQLAYLHGHELITGKWALGYRAIDAYCTDVRLTSKGIDLLEDDGGISAVLGVVTVKLHSDTLLALVEQRIQDSDLPVQEKSRMRDQLRGLSTAAIKHLTLRLLDKALDQGPQAIQWLEKALRNIA